MDLFTRLGAGGLRMRSATSAIILLIAAAPVWGQEQQADPQEVDPNLPLVVINVASVERLFNQAFVAFEAAGRAELSETLGGALARVNDLQGFDRSQSVGVMIFLAGIGTEAVGYAPVKNLDEVLKTVEIGPVTTRKTGDDRFEIVTPRQTLFGKVQEDYAFVANSAAALDRQFRDPAALTARLSRSYDLAVSFNLKSVPPLSRDLFLAALRAKSESDLQRGDDEPEAAHKLRKAAGMQNIELIEQLILQGREVTAGWSVSESEKRATLEIVAAAVPGSELATMFNDLRGTSTRFANLLAAKTPLTASLSWKIGKSGKAMFREMISALESQLSKSLAGSGTDSELAEQNPAVPVRQWANALRSTTDGGHLDAVMLYVGQPGEAFVLVGGVKVADAASLAGPLSDILRTLKANRALADVALDVHSHGGVRFHRLEFEQSRENEERLYGGKPRLYVGVGDDIVWLGFGGSSTEAELDRAIDTAAEPLPQEFATSPFRTVVNFSAWTTFLDSLARDAFSKGGDSLRLEAQPIDNGLRLRVTMDEAFLRLVGQQVARLLDQAEMREAGDEE